MISAVYVANRELLDESSNATGFTAVAGNVCNCVTGFLQGTIFLFLYFQLCFGLRNSLFSLLIFLKKLYLVLSQLFYAAETASICAT
jgi:hypothetical protein